MRLFDEHKKRKVMSLDGVASFSGVRSRFGAVDFPRRRWAMKQLLTTKVL